MSNVLKPPKYPLDIITPRPHAPLSTGLKILKQACNSLLKSSETYSVTFSELVCPVDKHYLFALKPYWWEVEPGRWEHRDGRRNSYCDRAQGPKQLETMAKAVMTLAMGNTYLGEDIVLTCRGKALQLLKVFFMDKETRMLPQIEYAQCNPSELPLHGDGTFVLSVCYQPHKTNQSAGIFADRLFLQARYLILVTQALKLLNLEAGMTSPFKIWFQEQVDWMETSPQGKEAREYGNNISMWYYALLYSNLAYIDRSAAKQKVLALFTDLEKQFPTSADFFARELSRTRPRHYTLFMLEPIFILADLTRPIDTEMSRIVPPEHVLDVLSRHLEFAEGVKGGEIEVEIDNDERYHAKSQFFQRTLGGWRGEEIGGDEPNCKPWEGGWTQRMRLMWSCLGRSSSS